MTEKAISLEELESVTGGGWTEAYDGSTVYVPDAPPIEEAGEIDPPADPTVTEEENYASPPPLA